MTNDRGEGFVETEGGRLRYRWAGRRDGPVLVFSHSLGTASDLWSSQEASLGNRFRLLLYDHRGHGESSAPEGEWTIDDFGRDALTVIEELAPEPVYFCGVSLGGMVGLWLARTAPDRLKRLVVANTSAFTEDPALLRGRLEEIERNGLESIAENVLDRWFTRDFRRSHPAVVERFRRRVLATPDASYIRTSEAVCNLDLRSKLGSIQRPTLVITGEFDEATPPAWGESIARAVPGASLASLRAAHLSNVEAASSFDEAVIRFLKA